MKPSWTWAAVALAVLLACAGSALAAVPPALDATEAPAHHLGARAEVSDGGIVVVVLIILGLVVGSCCLVFCCFFCIAILVFVILTILGVDVAALLGTVFFCIYKKEKASRPDVDSYGASEYGKA